MILENKWEMKIFHIFQESLHDALSLFGEEWQNVSANCYTIKDSRPHACIVLQFCGNTNFLQGKFPTYFEGDIFLYTEGNTK